MRLSLARIGWPVSARGSGEARWTEAASGAGCGLGAGSVEGDREKSSPGRRLRSRRDPGSSIQVAERTTTSARSPPAVRLREQRGFVDRRGTANGSGSPADRVRAAERAASARIACSSSFWADT